MEMYFSFAQVYDEFMNNVPYDKWVQYIMDLYKKYNHKPKLVLDLGCGTGNITNKLAKKGIDMIGIDLSEDMLGIAKEKARRDNLDILFLNQDMADFELYGTVDSVVSICDSINYVLEEEELLNVFKLVNNYLDPKGLFIFDMNTEYKFKEQLGDNTYTEVQDDCAYIWDNFYSEEDKINEYNVTFFVKQKQSKNNLYQRFHECHYERSYSIEKIKQLIDRSGLKLIDCFDAFTFNKPTDISDRVYFIAQEITKNE